MAGNRTLYIGEKNLSSWSMRAWLALKHKGLSFEARSIAVREDRDRQERRRVSPTGKVPVLHDGEFVIPDSLAIVEYLEETYPPPAHPALWPSDKKARVHARWLAAAMHSGFAALRAGMSFNLCFLDEDLRASKDALVEAREILGLWEDALARKQGPKPYLFGAWSAADVMFAPVAVRLSAFKVSTADTPRAAAYLRAVLEQPDVAAWLDEARTMPTYATY